MRGTMRFLKALWLVFFFFAALIFFTQNHDVLVQTMELKLDLYFFDRVFTSTSVPLYFVILAAFLVGGVFSIVLLILDRMRLSMECRAARREVRRKEREIKNLKAARPEPVALPEPGLPETVVTDGTEK